MTLFFSLILSGTPTQSMPEWLAVLKYVAFVVVEGDWANDWLTHLATPGLADAMQLVGQWLASVLPVF